MHPVTPDQRRLYDAQGYLLLSGLIPTETASAADAALWGLLGIDPARPETWAAVARGHHAYEAPELVACFTPAFLAAAAALVGEEPGALRKPSHGYCIPIFPRPGPWEWPGPHIDHAIKDHGHKTFPRAFRVATMTFLHDVGPHEGGTVVWPGSHRALEGLARSDPEHYELMWTLNQAMDRAALGPPIELTPRAGDVLFYQVLCAHAGSTNTGSRPRFAMNQKW